MPVVYSMDTTRMLGGRRIRGIARILCQLYLQLSHSFLKFRVTFFQLSILSLQHSNNGLSHGGKSAICSSVISDDMHEYVPDFAILEKQSQIVNGYHRMDTWKPHLFLAFDLKKVSSWTLTLRVKENAGEITHAQLQNSR